MRNLKEKDNRIRLSQISFYSICVERNAHQLTTIDRHLDCVIRPILCSLNTVLLNINRVMMPKRLQLKAKIKAPQVSTIMVKFGNQT